MPDFLPETTATRNDPSWKGPSLAPGLVDRKVEITGPVDRKMVINALNSEATQYMADFEDSLSPTWENCLDGQVNLYDAVRGSIKYSSGGGQREYMIKEPGRVTLLVRPRGLHMDEAHLEVDGKAISASFFDFAIFFCNNARELLSTGKGPYFYLPKLEAHGEAALWAKAFELAEQTLSIPLGTIRATVLIETLPAAFEMEEIIYQLRQYSAGLNCGRWDYIFSFIKKLGKQPSFILPNRSDVTMTAPFMQAYVKLLIYTCHKRKVHAMGGMAAHIPIKSDEEANRIAMERVRADKLREAMAGHDGTWVAHPALIPIAKKVFDEICPGPNQLHLQAVDPAVAQRDLLNCKIGEGRITQKGINDNIAVSLQYLEAWLNGVGCVPLNHMMEDAATAEISRAQIWQWIFHSCKTEDGKLIEETMIRGTLHEQVEGIKDPKKKKLLLQAKSILESLYFAKSCPDFMTLSAYSILCENKDAPNSKL